MKELIDVFRMSELSAEARVNLIIKMGRLINDEHCANITEPVVYELVKILDPKHEILQNPHYKNSK